MSCVRFRDARDAADMCSLPARHPALPLPRLNRAGVQQNLGVFTFFTMLNCAARHTSCVDTGTQAHQ